MNSSNNISEQITMRSETLSIARIAITTTEQLAPIFIPARLLKDLSLASVDEIEMKIIIDRTKGNK